MLRIGGFMATKKQITAAKKNIKKASKKWQSMSSRARALAQPQGKRRAKPGSTGKGEYYHITVRPKTQFTSFRVHDVGKKGHLQRVAGRRPSGSWATHKWLINKTDAKVVNKKIIGVSVAAKKVIAELSSAPKHYMGDKFTARPKKNVPESQKPTPAQKRARAKNIKKAQAAKNKK